MTPVVGQPLSVGLIGCGNISTTYLGNAGMFAEAFRIVAVADVNMQAARTAGEQHGIPAIPVEAMLADPAIEAILNLTVPSAHVPVARAAIETGKHVYVEKPLGLTVADATALLAAAATRGLRIGVAPDTFLGAAHQTARRLVDEGAIGRVVGGNAAVMGRGMENWHPNPAFFFAEGGGPLFDMGPYYLASLVDLIGPARSVLASGGIGVTERTIGNGPRKGAPIPILTPTTINALIRFDNGADIVFSASWDVWTHKRPHLELYGTEGTLALPDPNWFGGPVRISRRGGPWEEIFDPNRPFGQANRGFDDGEAVADYRGCGLADMAQAIRQERPHRAGEGLGLHVLSIMEATGDAVREGRNTAIAHPAARPDPMPPNGGL